MTDDESLTVHETVIGGHRHVDDYTVIWRGKTIGRIMKSAGVLKGRRHRWWGCNVDGRLPTEGGSGSAHYLDDCKRQFRATWAALRAALTEEDIARVHKGRCR
jgi:hypothetical protein